MEDNNKLNDSILQLSQKMQDELGLSMDTKADTAGSGTNSNSSSTIAQWEEKLTGIKMSEDDSGTSKKSRKKQKEADSMKFNPVQIDDEQALIDQMNKDNMVAEAIIEKERELCDVRDLLELKEGKLRELEEQSLIFQQQIESKDNEISLYKTQTDELMEKISIYEAQENSQYLIVKEKEEEFVLKIKEMEKV